jgi:hypothetical protein
MCARLQDDGLRLRPLVLPENVALALPWYADLEVMDLSEDTSEAYSEDTVRVMYRYLMERGEVYVIEVREPAATTRAGRAPSTYSISRRRRPPISQSFLRGAPRRWKHPRRAPNR